MARKATELMSLIHLCVEAPGLVESEDTECHPNDAGRLSTDEFHNGFCPAHSFPCELRQRMRLRVIPHLIESAHVQTMNPVCFIDD